MLTELFTVLTSAGGAFTSFLGSLIQSVLTLFWTKGDGAAAGSFTDLGVLLLIGVAIGVTYGVIRWVTKLVTLKHGRS